MRTITYIQPSRATFLAKVQYKSGEEKAFDYVVGAYKKDKYLTTLVNIDGEDIVDILDNIYSKITFAKHTKDI